MRFVPITMAIALAGLAQACASPDFAASEPGSWTIGYDTASFADAKTGEWLRLECKTAGRGRSFVHLLRSPTPEIGEHLVQDMTITGAKGEAWVRISASDSDDGGLVWSGPVLDDELPQIFTQASGTISIELETGGVLTVPAQPAVAEAMANCTE